MGWVQKEIRLGARSRGFHLVTAEILQQLPELREFRVGLATSLFSTPPLRWL